MHRKRNNAGMVRHILTGLALLALTAVLAVAAILAGQAPAAASGPSWQTQTAVMLAHDATLANP